MDVVSRAVSIMNKWNHLNSLQMAGCAFMSFRLSGSESSMLIKKLGFGPMKNLDQGRRLAKNFGLHNVIGAFLDQGGHPTLMK